MNDAPGSCPACQVPVTVAAKEEGKSGEVRLESRSESVPYSRPVPRIRLALRELTLGLRYHPTVFQLKDDLRV